MKVKLIAVPVVLPEKTDSAAVRGSSKPNSVLQEMDRIQDLARSTLNSNKFMANANWTGPNSPDKRSVVEKSSNEPEKEVMMKKKMIMEQEDKEEKIVEKVEKGA